MGKPPPKMYNGMASQPLIRELARSASQPPNNIVQTPQVPPINMPEALDTKLQTVDLPAFYEDAALDTLEKGVRNGMDIVEKLHKIVAPDPAAIREDFKAWHEQLASLKAENFHYKVIIGVVGSTGAGKSSVINALLDEERLVPTNVSIYSLLAILKV